MVSDFKKTKRIFLYSFIYFFFKKKTAFIMQKNNENKNVMRLEKLYDKYVKLFMSQSPIVRMIVCK